MQNRVLLISIFLSVFKFAFAETIEQRVNSHKFPRLSNQLTIGSVLPFDTLAPIALSESRYYDLLLIDSDLVNYNPEYLGPNGILRQNNPNQIIINYFSAGDVKLSNIYSQHTVSGSFAKWLETVAPQFYMQSTNGSPFPLFLLPPPESYWTLMLDFHYTDPVLGRLADHLVPRLQSSLLGTELSDGIMFDWASDWIGWLTLPEVGRTEVIDTDRNGQVDPVAIANANLVEGLTDLFQKTRASVSNSKILMGNSGGGIDGAYKNHLNGVTIETFQDQPQSDSVDPLNPNSWSVQMRRYAVYAKQAVSPRLSWNMTRSGAPNPSTPGELNSPVNLNLARFTLASTLMFDGYYNLTNPGSYYSTKWIDEFGVNASGLSEHSFSAKGYLGSPLEEAVNARNPQEELYASLVGGSEVQSKVWKRRFEKGIVFVNPSRDTQWIDLGGTYKFIKGTGDTLTNNGAGISRISLAPRTGIVLLNACAPSDSSCFQIPDFSPTLSFDTVTGGSILSGDGSQGMPYRIGLPPSGVVTIQLTLQDPDIGEWGTVECNSQPSYVSLNAATRTLTIDTNGGQTNSTNAFSCWAKDGHNFASVPLYFSVNRPPVTNSDVAVILPGQSVTVNVIANDSDSPGEVLSVSSVSQPTQGQISFSNGSVTYTAPANYKGTITVDVTVSDPEGALATSALKILVVDPYTWIGNAGDKNWYNRGNWAGGAVPQWTNTAFFSEACLDKCDLELRWGTSVGGIELQPTYTGTIRVFDAVTVTVGNNGYRQYGGNLDGGTGNFTCSGDFLLSGGTFKAPSRMFTFGRWTGSGANAVPSVFTVTGGNFNPNGGTVLFSSTLGETTWAIRTVARLSLAIPISFNNLIIDVSDPNSASTFDSSQFEFLGSQTATVLGTFTHRSGRLLNGRFDLRQNLVVECSDGVAGQRCARGGWTVLRMVGTSDQVYDSVGGGRTAALSVLNNTAAIIPSARTSNLNISSYLQWNGSFTAPPGVLDIGIGGGEGEAINGFVMNGGVFNHNFGTINLSTTRVVSTPGIVPTAFIFDVNSSLTLNNLTINVSDSSPTSGFDQVKVGFGVGDTIRLKGAFVQNSARLMNGTIIVEGSLLKNCPSGTNGQYCARTGTTDVRP